MPPTHDQPEPAAPVKEETDLLTMSTDSPSVPLTLALRTNDLDSIVRYAEATVRHVAIRWYSNAFVYRQMQQSDLSQMLRLYLMDSVYPSFNLDMYEGKPDREVQRLFGRFVQTCLDNFMKDFAKRYTRNPDRFSVDGAFNMDSIVRSGSGDVSPSLFSDLISTGPNIDTDGDEPVVDQVEFKLLMAQIAVELDEEAYHIARMRIEGHTTDEIAAELGVTAQRVRSLLARTIRPAVAKMMHLRNEVAFG